MNLDQLFRANVESHPDHPAIRGGMNLSYAELDALIDERAAALKDSGIKPGDTVGLHCPSGLSYIIFAYAVWRCEACVIPFPVELAPDEKRRILDEFYLRWLIGFDSDQTLFKDSVRQNLRELGFEMNLFSIDSEVTEPPELSTINSAFIRLTSGTTGNSKGVVLSHETIRERIEAANEVLKLNHEDRVVWLLSMSYHFAVSIVAYLSYGCTIILPENLFADAIVKAVDTEKGTFMYGSPTQYSWVTNYDGKADLSSLRMAVSTTCPLDESLGRAFEKRFHLPLTQALGIIEVGLPCINVDFASTRPAAIGSVLPAYEWKLRPVDDRIDEKELLLKGPGVLDAYYRPWQSRAQIMTDGWFATGDVCTIDENGCLEIEGRSKDIISVSGMKFFPQEVEEVLCAHTRVEAARVYSTRHPRWGELAKAEIIAAEGESPTQAELVAWCTGRLAPYKIPTDIEFVTEFPLTASGKVLHRKT